MITKPRPITDQDVFNNVWQHFIVEVPPVQRTIGGWDFQQRQ